MITPLSYYQAAIVDGTFLPDPAQAAVVQKLNDLQKRIQQHYAKKWWHYFQKKTPVKGLYLWGSVGAGKTWLMDCFFKTLPTTRKYRTHFHGFMQEIQEKLYARQGMADPLFSIAKDFSKKYDVLCFDEWFVEDIGDAMLLGTLLSALFHEGVTLVATSNTEPHHLYRNGLQRDRFLPAIALIETHMDIVKLQSKMDYRFRTLHAADVYFTPITTDTTTRLQKIFDACAHGHAKGSGVIQINNRAIEVVNHAVGIVWFNFAMICSEPRASSDYLVIAKQYPTVILSNIPVIHPEDDNHSTYFINLIDIFYDHRTKLIMSAEVRPEEMYANGRLNDVFQRTLSRIHEMQTDEYLEAN